MKKIGTNIIYLLIFFMSNCDKFDLKRDNPLDVNNNNYIIKFSRYEIVEVAKNGIFSSSDTIAKGENIYLNLYFKNIGTITANEVRIIVSCNNSYINGLFPTTDMPVYDTSWNDFLAPGEEGVAYNVGYDSSIIFGVSSTTPTGTQITFNLSITDDSNYTWTDSFKITVY